MTGPLNAEDVPVSSPSTVPPPAEGGGARYAIAGVALLALAGLGWCLTRPPEAPVTRVEPDAGPVVERSTALVEDSLDIPELVVDTGVPDAGPPRPRPILGRAVPG
jgi:hypothetical protein